MVEAIAVVGLIGSIIGITNAIQETYQIATESHRLPQAFAVVNERIPVVQRTLSLVQTAYSETQDEDAIRESLTTCKDKAEDLRYIFEKVRRYSKALRTLKPGRGDKVEYLFKDILDTLQTLQAYHIFKNIIPVEDLMAAVEEIESVDPSMPESNNTTINSSGSGALINSGPGRLTAKQQYGEGSYQAEVMNFQAPAVQETLVRNPTLSDPFYDSMLDRQRVDYSLFVPRMQAVDNLAAKFKRKSKNQRKYRHAVVVHGMGGTGKTQLVLQYIEKYQHEYSTVLWIDATSAESYVLSCRRICINLRLSDAKHYGATHQALVPQTSMAVDHLLSWLVERPSIDNWLVVIDNLDDMSWGVTNVVPRGTSANLIVTTRDSFNATALGFPRFLVESMEKAEAASFLRIAAFRELDDTSDELEALCAEFCTLVDHLPLAIHLAAATIGGDSKVLELDDNIGLRDACLAMTRHMERFNTNKDLLLMGDAHKYMQSPYPRTLLTTFETTFVKLKENCGPHAPPAMDLLRLLAFLDDGKVSQLHERFRLAYRAALTDYQQYATLHLPKWLAKLLTGESSVALFPAIRGRPANWDDQSFRDTLGLLQRYGLVRPRVIGSSEIVPLHKIVRWRVQKEGEHLNREVLSEYVIVLQLALSSSLQDPDQTLRISDELANAYFMLARSQEALECAEIHLDKSIRSYGRPHPNTVRSLARLIEILCSMKRQDQVAREVFAFVRDADDRNAVLEALPSDLLLIFQNVFTKPENKSSKQHKSRHALLDHQSLEKNSVIPFPLGLPSKGDSPQQQTVMWPGKQTALFRPGHDTSKIHDQISQQIANRTQILQAKSHLKPDLITLFEVLSLGSRSLISSYMRYIDSETVSYLDPICGRTVLHFIAAFGGPEDVQVCVEKGADIRAIDWYGSTPLQIAGLHGRSHVFRGLVQSSTKDSGQEAPRMMRDAIMPSRSPIKDQVGRHSLEPLRQRRLNHGSGSQMERCQSRTKRGLTEATLQEESRQPSVEEYESNDSWTNPRIGPSGPSVTYSYNPREESRQPYVEEYESDDSWTNHGLRVSGPGTTYTYTYTARTPPVESDQGHETPHSGVGSAKYYPSRSSSAVRDTRLGSVLENGSGRVDLPIRRSRESIELKPTLESETYLADRPVHYRSRSTASRTPSVHTQNHSDSSQTKELSRTASSFAIETSVPQSAAESSRIVGPECEAYGNAVPSPPAIYSICDAKVRPSSRRSRSLEVPPRGNTRQELLSDQADPDGRYVPGYEEKNYLQADSRGQSRNAESTTGDALPEGQANSGIPEENQLPPPRRKRRRRRHRHHSPSDPGRTRRERFSPDVPGPEVDRSARIRQKFAPAFDARESTPKTSRPFRNSGNRKKRDEIAAETSNNARRRSYGARSLFSGFWEALMRRGSSGK